MEIKYFSRKTENGTKNYEKVTCTADDEFPDCMMCEHVDGNFDCCGSCGAEHGWYGYVRTEINEVELED